MHFGARERARFFLLITILAALGVASTVYMLAQQRFPDPFADTYTVKARFSAADGVVAGLGQPVNVAGVKVGSVTDTAHDEAGNAVLTLELNRDELADVRTDARVTLDPITPLKDMQLNLEPGSARAPKLAADAVLGLDRTHAPVALDTLLSSLDSDTRTFLAGLLGTLGDGTRNRGNDLRRTLQAFGPTTAQVRRITTALEARRTELAGLVHNLGAVTDAAAEDGRLVQVVQAGEATLQAVASQEAPLRESIARMPATFAQARSTLANAAEFSDTLRPAVDALLPATSKLAGTLEDLEPFTDDATVALRSQIRPLVRELQPTLNATGPAVQRLAAATPDLFDTAQSVAYLLNEFAFNPEGTDEGGLFWAAWMLHNFNSTFSLGEAHGGAGRASVFLSCQQITATLDLGQVVKLLTGSPSVCPGG